MKNVITRFLKYWKKQNYQKMYQLTQKTWQSGYSQAAFKVMFSGLNLQDFKIGQVSGNNIIGDVQTVLKINDIEYNINGRLVRERAAYKPDEKGNWGINPISLLKFDEKR